MKQEEVINSSAYKLLNFLIEEKKLEISSRMESIRLIFEAASKPFYMETNWETKEQEKTYYKPRIRVGTSFDKEEDLEVPYELRDLKRISEIIQEITKLKDQIQDLNIEKLYLIKADYDWDDGGRRSKAVFGVEEIEG